jgi:circadian clock protein KaiB
MFFGNPFMRKSPKLIDSIKSFEDALRLASHERYVLRLYIAGTTPRSIQAVASIRAICEDILPGKYDLEVIDIYQKPQKAAPEQIVVVPTLLKKLPLPARKIIGDLSNKNRVLHGLDLAPNPIAG